MPKLLQRTKYNPIESHNRCYYTRLQYFFWFFQCLTGWCLLDRINLGRLNAKRDLLILNGEGEQTPSGPSFYDKLLIKLVRLEDQNRPYNRYGVLDYLFVIPALIKLIVASWDRIETFTFKNPVTWLALLVFTVGTIIQVGLVLIYYPISFFITVLVSPILYRQYDTLQKQKAIVETQVSIINIEKDSPFNENLKFINRNEKQIDKRTANQTHPNSSESIWKTARLKTNPD